MLLGQNDYGTNNITEMEQVTEMEMKQITEMKSWEKIVVDLQRFELWTPSLQG